MLLYRFVLSLFVCTTAPPPPPPPPPPLSLREIIESDHLLLEFYIDMSKENQCAPGNIDQPQYIERYFWKAENAQHFSDQINKEETLAKLSHATYWIDVDLNKALYMFNIFLKQQADCMKKRINVNQKRKLLRVVIEMRFVRPEGNTKTLV